MPVEMRVYVPRSSPWTRYILVDLTAHADCGADRRWYTWSPFPAMSGTTHRWEPSLTGSDRLRYPWMRRSGRSDCQYSRGRRVLRLLVIHCTRATVSPCQEQTTWSVCSCGCSHFWSSCSSRFSRVTPGMLLWMYLHRRLSPRLRICHISSWLCGLDHSILFYSLVWAHWHSSPGSDPWARVVSILLVYPVSNRGSRSPSHVWLILSSAWRYLVRYLCVRISPHGRYSRRVTFSRRIVDCCRYPSSGYCHMTRYRVDRSQHWYDDKKNLEDSLWVLGVS